MSTKRSVYEKLILESNDQSKTVDIRLGTYSIDYYEDVFSPTVTAKIVVMDTGESVAGTNGGYQSIYNGLPLRGGERLTLKIAGNSQTNNGLDFSTPDSYLYVSSISNVISMGQREIFTLNLVSREAITNETSRVYKKFSTGTSIDSSVSAIIKDNLKTTKVGKIDKTSNKYGFIGNSRKPFTVLVWLASKSVPTSSGAATAGFFFYQTQDGFQFRAIDNLIKQKPKATYTYTEVNESDFSRNNSFTIISYTTERNQNLIEKLRLGAYSSYRMFYDPLTFQFTNPQRAVFKLDDYAGKKSVSLGVPLGESKNFLPKISSSSGKSLGDSPSRIITAILDVGTLEKGVSTEKNADPLENQSQSIMRYNLMFTQTVSMTVPLNTNLRAGDIIKCEFPKISQSDKNVFDEEQSGLYMIKELCHHFDTEGSYTSMKLIRDSFGKYGVNNK